MNKKIIDFYSKEELLDIKEIQFQNTFISEHKDEFFSICNKILDFLYTEEETDKKRKNKLYKDASTIKNLSQDFELIRKKIRNNAPLAKKEISFLLVAAQYTCADLSKRALLFEQASKELENYIKILTFQS